MPVVETQSVSGADQFDGSSGKGIWEFTKYKHVPRTTAVIVNLCSYSEDGSGPPALDTAIAFYFFRPGETDLTKRILIGRDDAKTGTLLNPATGSGEATFVGFLVPRGIGNAGVLWNVILLTKDKGHNASASVVWGVVPVPDTSPDDSPE